MAHTFKAGDKVILGHRVVQSWTSDMDQYVGKEAILTRVANTPEGPAWFVSTTVWYWLEKNFTLIGCPCDVKMCLTHNKKNQ